MPKRPIMAAREFQTSAFSVNPQNRIGSLGSSFGGSTPVGSLAAALATSSDGLDDALMVLFRMMGPDWSDLVHKKLELRDEDDLGVAEEECIPLMQVLPAC